MLSALSSTGVCASGHLQGLHSQRVSRASQHALSTPGCCLTRLAPSDLAPHSYIERAGGCDKIQDIVCEATNAVAVKHYREQAAASPRIQAALDCIEKRCGVTV